MQKIMVRTPIEKFLILYFIAMVLSALKIYFRQPQIKIKVIFEGMHANALFLLFLYYFYPTKAYLIVQFILTSGNIPQCGKFCSLVITN